MDVQHIRRENGDSFITNKISKRFWAKREPWESGAGGDLGMVGVGEGREKEISPNILCEAQEI
jgi:hypothetical protein